MIADHFGLHDNISDQFWLFSQLQFDYSHLQRKFSFLMIANFWVDLDSKFKFEYEYEHEYLTWINLVHVTINDLLIPIIDQWALNTIQHRRRNIFGRYLTIYHQVAASFIQFHQIASNYTRLRDMNDHDENEVKFDLIENWLLQSFSHPKSKLINFSWILCRISIFHIDFDFAFTNHNSFI
jgi:hypothetical protein